MVIRLMLFAFHAGARAREAVRPGLPAKRQFVGSGVSPAYCVDITDQWMACGSGAPLRWHACILQPVMHVDFASNALQLLKWNTVKHLVEPFQSFCSMQVHA